MRGQADIVHLPRENYSDALNRLADALGEPVSVFYGTEAMSLRLADTKELLRLWLSLTNDQARARVLAAARAATAAQSD